jgi:hypothetical protein
VRDYTVERELGPGRPSRRVENVGASGHDGPPPSRPPEVARVSADSDPVEGGGQR